MEYKIHVRRVPTTQFINMKFVVVLFLALGCVLAHPLSSIEEKTPLWERSGKFQGDIVLTPEQERSLLSRNGLINVRYRWAKNTIPYKFGSGVSAEVQSRVRAALEEYKKTCITVREATSSDKDYVLVTSDGSGCWSSVGRTGGAQTLNLQHNSAGTCLSVGTVVHEFLHALGFYHQQSASDRDNFVTIAWNNIQSGLEHNFDVFSNTTITDFGVKYDYSSVMHYSAYAFSKNGEATIIPKDPNAEIGQRVGFSAGDILKLNRMYGCA